MARKRSAPATPPNNPVTTELEARKPLVFISHDTRDADIAEAFADLLIDASGGVLQSFRSSDRKGIAGIEFGAEWYRAIMERIESATDVVALLTPLSVNRPWILYEAGVAKGKLDRVVFGLAIGIPLTEASVGPFAQLQNSGDDEDSLTKLVLQLIRRNPDADPREEAVRRQVTAFCQRVVELMKQRPEKAETTPAGEHSGSEEIAKLFEEVKVMFRELPERLGGTVRSQLRRGLDTRRSKVSYGVLEDLFFTSNSLPPKERVMGWLVALTPVREEAALVYDLLLEAQRAVQKNDARLIKEIARSLERVLQTSELQWLFHRGITESEEEDHFVFGLMRHLPDMLSRLAAEMPPRRSYSRAGRRVIESAVSDEGSERIG